MSIYNSYFLLNLVITNTPGEKEKDPKPSSMFALIAEQESSSLLATYLLYLGK